MDKSSSSSMEWVGFVRGSMLNCHAASISNGTEESYAYHPNGIWREHCTYMYLVTA